MPKSTTLVLAFAAVFAVPLAAGACSEQPTTVRAPGLRLECNPTMPTPPDSTCRSGQIGSGGRTCC